MGHYATWSGDVLGRYPLLTRANSDASAANAAWIVPAEVQLESQLARKFSVPLVNTSGNFTVKDIVIDMVWLRAHNPYDDKRAESLRKSINERIDMLLKGKMQMMGDDGEVLAKSSGGVVWSNTMNYPPTFDHRHIFEMETSSSMRYDEQQAHE